MSLMDLLSSIKRPIGSLFLFILLFTRPLFAHVAVTENEPSALVEGIVSAVTGDLYALEDDIIIQGAEPLKLKRHYLSLKGGGHWAFFDHLAAADQPPLSFLLVNEPNGTTLKYHYKILEEGKHKKHKKRRFIFRPLNLEQDAQGLTNTAKGKISAKTNLKNQSIQMDEDAQQFALICPDGTKRVYKAVPNQKPFSNGPIQVYYEYNYRLHSEELPNGNKILYEWGKRRLHSIRTTDPSGQKTYARASFRYSGGVEEKHGHSYFTHMDFDIDTSDGRTLHYQHFSDGKPEMGRWYLQQITSTDAPIETLHYHPKESQRLPILAALTLPRSRGLHIGYYPSGNDPLSSCVRTLSAPVGEDATPLVTHTFHYDLPKRTTTVLDVMGIPTRYYWDEFLRLIRIDRYKDKEALHSGTLFTWGKGSNASNLLCRAFCDEKGEPVHATTYTYDAHGNVLLEKFWGNLTGLGKPLLLNAERLPVENGVESYGIKCSYSEDGKHLLLRKEEDNGLVVTYDYLSGTNLPLNELFYDQGKVKRRKFYVYNAERILTREIADDGSSKDKEDLTSVTERRITEIHPKATEPYCNMPECIEERYWDGRTEVLLKKTAFHYTTGGRIARKDIYDANGLFRYSLTYTYDEKGRLIKESNALGQEAVSGYDDLGNQISFRDVGGRLEKQMRFDCSNRLLEEREVGEDGALRSTQHRYDKKHNKVLTIDPYGHETRYLYNAQNQLIETHLPPLGNVQPILHASYNAAGQAVEHTDAKGYVTRTEYTAYGKPKTIFYPDGTQERFIYNFDGTLFTHTDQNGVETRYTYDVFGRPTSKSSFYEGKELALETYTYNGFHLIAKTDPEGNVTTYAYDGAGRLAAEELNGERVEYGYDVLGRRFSIKTGNLTTITEYDLLDRPVEKKSVDEKGDLFGHELYTYDAAGNQETITRFIDGKSGVERNTYDSLKRLIKEEDALGHATTTLYDDKLHQQTTIDPLGLQTIFSFNAHNLAARVEKISCSKDPLLREENFYDANKNLICKETTLFNPAREVITRWEYGPLDRLTALIEGADTAEQKTTHYTYTPTGKLSQMTKPSGILLTHTYDSLDHLASQTSSDGTVDTTYIHNRLGHLIRSDDRLLNTTLHRTYDAKGRLLTEQLPDNFTLSHEYDAQGRCIGLKLPDHSFISYTYDALHLRSVTRCTPSGNASYTHRFTEYDLDGNPLSEELICDLGSLNRTYDLADRPTALTTPYFTHDILCYDAVGNILTSRLHNETLHYTYDALYQLTSEQEHTYAYDALSNRLQKDLASYAVNALNQIPSEFTYTPDGNPSSHGNAHYAYDALDRLISVDDGAQRLQFTYDPLHRRLSKSLYHLKNSAWSLVQRSFFLYDDRNEIGSVDSSGTIQELRILGLAPQAEIGSAIAVELQGKVYAPLHDLHGNVARLISTLDSLHETYRYSAFGEEQASHGTQNPWRFSSKRTDDETGLIYYGRRYYTPFYGRWLTPDPLGFADGPNLYAFVHNAPLTHVDLYGLITTHDFKQMSIGFASPLYRPVKATVLNVWNNPRFQGSLQAFGGLAEASFGGGMTYATGGLAAPAGFAVMAHGCDHFFTGMRTVFTGRYGETATSQFLQKTGMSAQTAHFIDSGISVVGTMGGAASLPRSLSPLTMQKIGPPTTTFLRPHPASLSLPNRSATSSMRAQLLRNRLIAQEISGGHAAEVVHLEKQISSWLGEGSQLIRNKAGDSIFLSKDGVRKMRFDFIRPAPHKSPHVHLEHLVDGEWKEISRVYPIDVPHK